MSFVNPKRSLSQNFLVDEVFQRKIVDYGGYSPSEKVVEIGPGYGAITGHLLELTRKLELIEIDPDAVEHLRSRFVNSSPAINLENVLEVDFRKFGHDLRLIGNLPYHLSSAILLHINQYKDQVIDAVFMLQREVIDRLVAKPGSKEYGKLTVALQVNWSIDKVFDVPPTAFRPAPKVWSSVMHMRPHNTFSKVNRDRLKRILFAAFSKRRKTIRNALKGVVGEERLVQCSIDPTARPENLSVEDYVLLSSLD